MKFWCVINFLCYITLIFSSCRTGRCRRDSSGIEAGKVLEEVNPKPPASYKQKNLGEVVIAKPDGSLQCEPKSGLGLAQMAKEELPDIKILSSLKQNDGFIRIQTCGEETGVLNTYRIRGKDLVTAQKAGFILFEVK